MLEHTRKHDDVIQDDVQDDGQNSNKSTIEYANQRVKTKHIGKLAHWRACHQVTQLPNTLSYQF